MRQGDAMPTNINTQVIVKMAHRKLLPLGGCLVTGSRRCPEKRKTFNGRIVTNSMALEARPAATRENTGIGSGPRPLPSPNPDRFRHHLVKPEGTANPLAPGTPPPGAVSPGACDPAAWT